MNANANYIVLVVSESNLNAKVDGPGFESINDAIAHAEGITNDPQQRLTVAYIIPVDAWGSTNDRHNHQRREVPLHAG